MRLIGQLQEATIIHMTSAESIVMCGVHVVLMLLISLKQYLSRYVSRMQSIFGLESCVWSTTEP